MGSEVRALHTPSNYQELPSGWGWKRLDDVCGGVFDCPHSTPTLTPDGPYIARSQDIRSGVFRMHEAGQVSEATYRDRIARAEPQHGDLLYSREGTYFGIAAEIPPGVRVCLGQRMVLLRPNPSAIDFRFLRHWLNSSVMGLHIHGHRDGSVAERLNLPTIRGLPVAIAPLPEQRAIANILGALEDKIELNRRMSETLEALAWSLFKAWFVDFDPVRAKADDSNPGLPKALADLFPKSFAHSALGEIPMGWGVGKLGDVLEQRVERCVASADTAARPYVPIDCIASKSLLLTESKPGEEARSSLIRFYTGDLLFGAMRPYFHKVCIAPFDGTTRTTAFVLFTRKREDRAFATLLLHRPDTIDYATRHSTGSTIPYAAWSGSLEDMPVILPPPALREAFDGLVSPILARIPDQHFQNNTLANLRDTLLPKLLSGVLRVKDADRFVSSAA